MERNRIRRRLRAIFAEAAPTLPLGSYQVGVGPRGRDLSFGELRAYVHQALEALGPEERR